MPLIRLRFEYLQHIKYQWFFPVHLRTLNCFTRSAEKVTVKWAAEKLFVSESHLMHEFKVETGKTFNDCLKYYRIAKAKELLKQGTMRVNEIAAAVGFSDGRYFGQVFKEQVGVTPSEYAELIHEEK